MWNEISIPAAIVLTVLSYFAGNISPATLMGKLHGIDIRKEGSGNPGTTNVLRTLGVKAAACTLLIDVLKGVLPVVAGRLAGGELLACICGTAAFFGHIWPVFFHFKGGKGIATGFGVLVAFQWPVGLVCLAAALAGAALSRRMSVGSVAAAVILPAAMYFTASSYTVWALCLALIVLWRHRTNIVRLIRGDEPPMNFSKKKKAAASQPEEQEESIHEA